MFKKLMVWILTLSLLMVSASAAFAEDAGLFSLMNETEYADERLPVLDEAAETVAVSRTDGSVTVEIVQAYYEGNRVYVAYRADGPISEQDGLDLEDGEYADIIAGGSVRREDGSVIGWKECIVPEDHLADTLTFQLVYRVPGSEEKISLGFTLNHHEYGQYLQGTGSGSDYQARAILYTGKVDLKGIVILTSPEQAASWLAWENEGEGTGTDVIGGWNLYQNGELIFADLDGSTETLTDGVAFSVMFPWMEDLSGLTLVPEYSETGEKLDEAIVLEPMDP